MLLDIMKGHTMKGKFSDQHQATTASTTASDTIRGVPDKFLRDCVAAIVTAGACVMFAATRNGDALVVTLLNGNEKGKVYVSSVQELKEALQDAVASVAEV
jgi:hypothetical protein